MTYQSMTVDLYAPLMVLMLLFSLLFLLLSCSCSHLYDQYRSAAQLASQDKENDQVDENDPTILLSRYEHTDVSNLLKDQALLFRLDFQLSQATTSSLGQFCIQFGGYLVILFIMETGKRISGDQDSQEKIQEKIDNFSFSSLWFSCLGSGLSLTVGQYSAFKIQHGYDLTLGQRYVVVGSHLISGIIMVFVHMQDGVLPVLHLQYHGYDDHHCSLLHHHHAYVL